MPQRVDFYLLNNSDEASLLNCACRVAGKAYQQGLNVCIQVDSEDKVTELDDLLWTFNPVSFVPHEAVIRGRKTSSSPVLISAEPEMERWSSLLLTMTREVPKNAERFSRVADLILNTEEHKRFGRERFRYYRSKGLEPNTHHININI
jgi:DNA polymerase-3 subunit chi